MKILITGGCGFIGSHVVARLYKEGHEIFIIDNLCTGEKSNVQAKHIFYLMDVTDTKCERVFRNNNIDVLIHLAGREYKNVADQSAYAGCKHNVSGLVNMLDLARKYQVKKFIFASTAAVYGEAGMLPITEDSKISPVSLNGIHSAIGEEYCKQWRSLYGLQTVILRLSNVYGPKQGIKGEAGVISAFIKQIRCGKDIVIYGDGNQTRDYIFVEDVADAITKVVESSSKAYIMNVSNKKAYSLIDIIKHLQRCGGITKVSSAEPRSEDIYKSCLDNNKLIDELGWKPKYALEEGLAKTYQWFTKEWKLASAKPPKKRGRMAAVRPYLENIILCTLMLVISLFNLPILERGLGIDYNYLYIAVMGLIYGKKQSLLATAFSAAIFIHYMLVRGADFVSLIYQIQNLAHLATYLCIGVVTGYITDNRARIAADRELELKSIKDKYGYLQEMYVECSEVKNNLYTQIINSNDSLGKIYNIVHELNSMRLESIYNAAINVVSKIMKTEEVEIYTVSKDALFLRLRVRKGENNLPNSICVADVEYARTLMKTKSIIVNKQLVDEEPLMAAPILYKGEVIAVIQIGKLAFENMTVYYENLFKITVMLITDSLIKAYLHERSTRDQKYIRGTEILITEEFDKVTAEITKRREMFNQDVAVLRLKNKVNDYVELSRQLAGTIRAEDFVGVKSDGYVYIILPNSTNDTAIEVQKRLMCKGVDTVIRIGEKCA